MKRHSIALKIFYMVTGVLILAFCLVFLMVKFQFTKVIDDTQRIAYTEKINVIIGTLTRQVDRLKATQQQAAYQEAFQNSVLDNLRHTYYTSSDQKIYPFIIDDQGKPVMHPFLLRGDNLLEIEPHLQKILTQKNGEFNFIHADSQKNWTIFTHFSEWNWQIGYVVPWDIKYHEARVLLNTMLLTMTLVVLCVAGLILIIILKLTQPIVTLTKASKAMAKGDLDHPIDIRRNDELGTLASNFLIMRDAIREKIIALTHSEARRKEVIDKSPIAMAVTTPDYKIVNYNQKFIELFGYTMEDIPSVSDWFPKAYPEEKTRTRIKKKWDHEIEHYFKTGRFNSMVLPVVCKDGSTKVIEFDFEAVGEQYITSFIDLTQQTHAKKELIEEKEFSEYLINSMPGIFFLYAHEKDQFLLKRWNKNHEDHLGYTGAELKDSPADALFEKKDRDQVKAAVAELLQKGRTKLELDIRRKDGALIPFYLQAFTFKKDDQLYFMGTGVDITERVIAEKENLELQDRLVQAQKMEAIGTLSGGIAHDFNNILSGIFGYTQLAETHIQNPEKAKKYLHRTFKGAQRAAELVQQILTFSRKTEHEKHPLNIDHLIKEVLQLLRSSIPATIKIKENLTPALPVMADATQMHQVVLNLCTNAYHAMSDKGGILTVSLKQIDFKGRETATGVIRSPGKYLELVISDTGHGMDEHILQKAFDPYFTTKEVGKGTGIGLALVKAIVEEHDGFLTVTSRIGKGSDFYVYLPVLEKKTDLPVQKKKNCLYRGTETLMVVDDEESIRSFVQELLTHCGYTVFSFQDGLQALHAFKKDPQRFDLVITDMTMPNMTGKELSENILTIRKNMPIILCTGYSENISESVAREIGIQKYIHKPIESKPLTASIRELLDS